MVATPDRYVFKYLRNGSNRDFSVDGGTPVDFDFTATQKTLVERVNFFFENANIRPATFAGLSALTNGCTLKVFDSDGTTELLDFLDGETFKTHSELANLAGIDVSIDDGVGDDVATIRWTISKAGETLVLDDGQIIRLTIQDDLTNIEKAYAMAQGVFDGDAE